jgi:cytochrome b6-f complex iron-sulfur subunit
MTVESPQQDSANESTRRRFLVVTGTTGIIAGTIGFLGATVRYLFPNVLYEPPSRFSVGRPEEFPPESVTLLSDRQLFLFRSTSGFHAISSVCTHLGCNVRRVGPEGFSCPCHGSLFDANGQVVRGPATRPLASLGLQLSPRRELVVDQRRIVEPNYRFRV